MKLITLLAVALVTLQLSTLHAVAGCDEYPLDDGMSVEETSLGPKIMSTATVVVSFDDTDEVLDAMQEGEMMAKARISKFFNETIQSDESLNKAVDTEIKIVGDQKSKSKSTLKQKLTSIRNSSQALLKGVVKIGDCYTKGEFIRITVGLKPETVNAAASGEKMINKVNASVKSSNKSTESSDTSTSGPESFSNSKGISTF